MSDVKRAFFLATAERYVVLALNLAILAALSRLLSAHEIGAAMIGMSIIMLAQSVRDFGTSAFIVQQQTTTSESIRTAFTITLLIATVLAGGMIFFGNALAVGYRDPSLDAFMKVAACSVFIGTFAGPSFAMLQREMSFGTLAFINIMGAVINGIAAIAMAALGVGVMSIAWAAVMQTATVVALAVILRHESGAFYPSLKGWRDIVSFGAATSTTYLLNRLNETLPYFVLGLLQPVSAVGHFNRATMICDLPLKGLLSGIFPVALPALANAARQGYCLATAYLNALSFITVVQWPGLVLVALLAHPIVVILLGPQWVEVVPLVQIIAISGMFSAVAPLAFPMLAAMGAVRVALVLSLVTLPIGAAIFVLAAHVSVTAAACSLMITIPLQNAASLFAVRRRVFFTWREFAGALWRSLAVTAATAAGPAFMIALAGQTAHLSIPAAIVAGILGVIGWFVGIAATGHPLLAHLLEAARRLPISQRFARPDEALPSKP